MQSRQYLDSVHRAGHKVGVREAAAGAHQVGPPGPFPPILLDGLQMESLSREHSLMTRGIARRREELEFAMAATKEEPHPRWESGGH